MLGIALGMMAALLAFVTYRDTVIRQTAEQTTPIVAPLHP